MNINIKFAFLNFQKKNYLYRAKWALAKYSKVFANLQLQTDIKYSTPLTINVNFNFMKVTIKDCTEDHLQEILAIFNDAIQNSTALYDYKTRTITMLEDWFADKRSHNHPIIGAFDENNTLTGFSTYGMFRARPAYKYTVEHSVYVEKSFRGKGIGSLLLHEIIKKAEEQDFHTMIAVIDTKNKASILLHEKNGFILNGIIKEVGYKFGDWLDAAFYQKILSTPTQPNEY